MPVMPMSVAMRGTARSGKMVRDYLDEYAGSLYSAIAPEGDTSGAGTSFGAAKVGPMEPLPPMDPKVAERAAQAANAASVAQNARTDAAGGTAQGANQKTYQGTGNAKTDTVRTGGVSTGAPGRSALRISVPGLGMTDYDADNPDPAIRAAFDAQRPPGGEFMRHRERTAQPAMDTSDAGLSYSAMRVPEAAQIASYDRFVRGREAEGQAYQTDMAESRAREVEASMRAEQPFYKEELAAKAKLAEAAVKAETEGAQRKQIMNVVQGAAQQVNSMRESPRYRALPPEQQKALEDQIWQQATLALSALTHTNLYPRPDPYSELLAATRQPAAPAAEEKR